MLNSAAALLVFKGLRINNAVIGLYQLRCELGIFKSTIKHLSNTVNYKSEMLDEIDDICWIDACFRVANVTN